MGNQIEEKKMILRWEEHFYEVSNIETQEKVEQNALNQMETKQIKKYN